MAKYLKITVLSKNGLQKSVMYGLRKLISLASLGKNCLQPSSARSVCQPLFSGGKVCHNSSRCGSLASVAVKEFNFKDGNFVAQLQEKWKKRITL